MIEQTGFGMMRTTAGEFRKDLILFGPGVSGGMEGAYAPWLRKEGHRVEPSDLAALESVRPEFLVIGRGAHGRMDVPEETLTWLSGIEIEAIVPGTTGEAAEAYNDLVGKGVRVAGAFHLTC